MTANGTYMLSSSLPEHPSIIAAAIPPTIPEIRIKVSVGITGGVVRIMLTAR